MSSPAERRKIESDEGIPIPKAHEVFVTADGYRTEVMEDDADPSYEPTKAEIDEYARFLGMDPKRDHDLLHIAVDGLKAPLPEFWRPCRTGKDVYYFNFKTGDSLWEHPSDDFFRKRVAIELEKLGREPLSDSEALGSPKLKPTEPTHDDDDDDSDDAGEDEAPTIVAGRRLSSPKVQAAIPKRKPSVVIPEVGETFALGDGTTSTVLTPYVDQDDITEAEIAEYAGWLEIDPVKESDLMWIAEEGIKAPLPEDWRPCKTNTGDVYYFNFRTGESMWDHPMDEHFKNKVKTEREKKKIQTINKVRSGEKPKANIPLLPLKEKGLSEGNGTDTTEPVRTRAGSEPPIITEKDSALQKPQKAQTNLGLWVVSAGVVLLGVAVAGAALRKR